MHLGVNNALSITNFTNNGCVLDTITNAIETQNLANLTLNNDLHYDFDVNLSGVSADTLTISSITNPTARSIVLNAINLMTTSSADRVDITMTTNDALKGVYRLSNSIYDNITGAVNPYEYISYDKSTGILSFYNIDYGNATIDNITKASKTYINGSHSPLALTKLDSGDAPDGTVVLYIGSDKYYFTPTAGNEDVLKNLANTGNVALVTTTDSANAIYSYTDGGNTTYYTYSTRLLPRSVWNATDGTASSYNYAISSVDTSGATPVVTTEYKNINLRTDLMTTTPDVVWTQAGSAAQDFTFDPATGTGSGTIEVKLPHTTVSGDTKDTTAETRYYTYNYSVPADYTQSDRISSLSGDVADKYFYNISSYSKGTTIYNNSSEGYDINADFLSNSNTLSSGAIYNDGVDAKLGTITGTFINNYSKSNGVAIYNEKGSIDKIVGDFIANKTDAHGGVITNNEGTINSISGNFIGNRASQGAVLYNINGSIGSITGNFISNTSSNERGAFWINGGTIGSITGDFINNSAKQGGAIWIGNSGTIGSITGDFIGNQATGGKGGAIFVESGKESIDSIVGNFIGNTSTSDGGAISLSGTASYISGDFIGNSGFTGGGIMINSPSNVTIENSLFQDNTASNRANAIAFTNGWTGSTANIINSKFINNVNSKGNNPYNSAISAYSYGNTQSTLNISDSYFADNGIAIHIKADSGAESSIPYIGKIENTVFKNNAYYDLLTSGSVGMIDNSHFGGAVELSGANAVIDTIKDSTFDGAFIFSAGNGNTVINTINHSIFNGTFTISGDNRYIGQIKDSTFNGAVIVSEGAPVGAIRSIVNSTFNEPVSKMRAGYEIIDSTFNKGVVMFAPNSGSNNLKLTNVNIYNGNFDGNNITIESKTGNVTDIDNLDYRGNTVARNGGFISDWNRNDGGKVCL